MFIIFISKEHKLEIIQIFCLKSLILYETKKETKMKINKKLKNWSICQKFGQNFYDKNKLLLHLFYIHQQYDNLCQRFFGIYAILDNHVKKSSLPLGEQESIEAKVINANQKKQKD